MGWLRRRRAGRPGDPFVAVVVEVFEQAGWAVEPDPTGAAVTAPTGGVLPLQPLRELCAGAPPHAWPDLVAEQVRPFVASVDGFPDLHDWAAVRPRLRTRLHRVGDPRVEGSGIHRPLAEGLLETVVLDAPTGGVPLDRDLVRSWSVTEGAVFAAARERVRRAEPVAVERLRVDGRELHFLTPDPDVDSAYVASHLTRVADLVPAGPLGLAIGVPDLRCAVVLPLAAPVGPGIDAVFRATRERFGTQHSAVSPDVHWWWEGVLRRIARAPHEGEDLDLVRTPDHLRLVELAAR